MRCTQRRFARIDSSYNSNNNHSIAYSVTSRISTCDRRAQRDGTYVERLQRVMWWAPTTTSARLRSAVCVGVRSRRYVPTRVIVATCPYDDANTCAASTIPSSEFEQRVNRGRLLLDVLLRPTDGRRRFFKHSECTSLKTLKYYRCIIHNNK